MRRTCAALSCGAAALFCGALLQAAVERQIPEQKIVRTEPVAQFVTFTYAPKAGEVKGSPVLYYSGEWGWTPLQQDASSYLASTGRVVLGIDAARYFSDAIPAEGLAADLTRFRAMANERAGRPKDAPVILIGFASGAEIIPYVLNQVGAAGVRGLVLIAPDTKGARIFRVSIRLDLESPPGERFDVADELRRMAPVPVVLMEGSLDSDSAAKALAEAPRGPHRYAPVVGGDRQFHEARDTFFEVLSGALQWIDGAAGAPGAGAAPPGSAASPHGSRGSPAPAPTPTAPNLTAPAATPEATPPGE